LPAFRSLRALRSAVRLTAFAAAVSFAALWIADPPSDSWAFPLSAYALTGVRSLWQLALALTAVTVLLLAKLPFAERLVAKRRALIVSALGLAAVAIVPTDPWFPWEHFPTLHGAIHVLATAVAMGSFALFAAMVVWTERRWTARLLPGSYVAGLTVTVGTVLVFIVIGRSTRFIGFAEWILLGLSLACCAESARTR